MNRLKIVIIVGASVVCLLALSVGLLVAYNMWYTQARQITLESARDIASTATWRFHGVSGRNMDHGGSATYEFIAPAKQGHPTYLYLVVYDHNLGSGKFGTLGRNDVIRFSVDELRPGQEEVAVPSAFLRPEIIKR